MSDTAAGFTDVSILLLVGRLTVLLETSVDEGEEEKERKAAGRTREGTEWQGRKRRRAAMEAERRVMEDRAF